MSFKLEFEIDGSTSTFNVFSASLSHVFGQESRLRATVLREPFQTFLENNSIANTEISFFDFGTEEFAGRLVDYENKKDRVELQIGTFEEDAINAEPTAATLRFENETDVNIVKDAISRVDVLSEGTIENIDSDIEIFFSNASPAKMIREIQRETGAYVRYNPDGSVDYVKQAGIDNTSTTIGPSNSNVSDEFVVNESDRDEYNHVRVLGSSQGDTQITAEAFTNSFDSSTDREIWKVYTDKEITNSERAKKIADTIIAEYDEAPVRRDVSTTVFGIDVNIGDTFLVQSDKDNVDERLEIVEVTRIFDGTQSVYDVVFSNRVLTRLGEAEKQRRDVEKFNQSFQGAVVTLDSGGYRAPVDTGKPYRLSVRKPTDVVDELTSEVEIQALPYRYYSGLGEHSHELDIDIPSHTHDVTVDIPNHSHDVSFTVPNHSHTISFTGHTHNVSVSGNVDLNNDHGSSGYDESLSNALSTTSGFTNLTSLSLPTQYEFAILTVSVTNADDAVDVRAGNSTDGYFPSSNGIPAWQTSANAGTGIGTIVVPTEIGSIDVEYDSNSGQGDIEVRALFVDKHDHPLSFTVSEDTIKASVDSVSGGSVSNTTTSDSSVTAQTTETSDAGGDVLKTETTTTKAGVDAGIEETTSTPSNVELIVNGNVVESGIGSGEFTEVVDIQGQLVAGFNEIEIRSDSLGHVRASVFQDLYRQITRN